MAHSGQEFTLDTIGYLCRLFGDAQRGLCLPPLSIFQEEFFVAAA
jgi:hypothetical protein